MKDKLQEQNYDFVLEGLERRLLLSGVFSYDSDVGKVTCVLKGPGDIDAQVDNDKLAVNLQDTSPNSCFIIKGPANIDYLKAEDIKKIRARKSNVCGSIDVGNVKRVKIGGVGGGGYFKTTGDVGNLIVTGDFKGQYESQGLTKKLVIRGDVHEAKINISEIGKFVVGGDLIKSQIEAYGGLGSLKVRGVMNESEVYVFFNRETHEFVEVSGNPLRLKIGGFVNSWIMTSQEISPLKLGYVDSQNGGYDFGIIYGNNQDASKVKINKGSNKGRYDAPLNIDDFIVDSFSNVFPPFMLTNE